MRSLLFEHGANQWNYLPEDDVEQELDDVAGGRAIAVVAESADILIGIAASYPAFIRFPDYTSAEMKLDEVGYIGDVVVHREYVGRGIGTKLLEQVMSKLSEINILSVYIDCHEENLASRQMMKKAGFVEVATYVDHERRAVGSRKTWVGCFQTHRS